MGAKNCPETPRQRMIGMMYIVLTAMIALNVSSDVLDAFTKVQAGLSNTLVNYTKKNNEIYKDFDAAYINNPTKVGPYKEKAYSIQERSRDLYNYISELKKEIVIKADGEDADIDNIKAKDNTDIAGEVMILRGKGTKLKEKINDYRQYLLGIVGDDNHVLSNAIETNLSTKAPQIRSGEPTTWESDNFENIPLVAVITLLTQMQADIYNAEFDVASHLFTKIDAKSFKFNKLNPYVIPNSRLILKGETYKAKVILAATDTTQQPDVIINGTHCKYEEEAAVFSRQESTVGVKTWKGVINFKTPSGQIQKYDIEDEYMVVEPHVVISPLKMNVFYLGVDNPVSISVPGITSDKLKVEITNGTIRKDGANYIVKPEKSGKSTITVSAIRENGKTAKLQILDFRVKTVPNPEPAVLGKSGGEITAAMLRAASGVTAEMKDFDFDMKFKVTGFSVFTVVNGYVKEAATQDNKLSVTQKAILGKVKRGQRVVFENITAVGPDGVRRKLPSITFKVK